MAKIWKGGNILYLSGGGLLHLLQEPIPLIENDLKINYLAYKSNHTSLISPVESIRSQAELLFGKQKNLDQ